MGLLKPPASADAQAHDVSGHLGPEVLHVALVEVQRRAARQVVRELQREHAAVAAVVLDGHLAHIPARTHETACCTLSGGRRTPSFYGICSLMHTAHALRPRKKHDAARNRLGGAHSMGQWEVSSSWSSLLRASSAT